LSNNRSPERPREDAECLRKSSNIDRFAIRQGRLIEHLGAVVVDVTSPEAAV
jgi:hypothetical protein